MAPRPQFRLERGIQRHKETEGRIRTQSKNTGIVCSLRTILPPNIKVDNTHQTDEESNSDYKFSHPLIPSDDCLQKNVVAYRQSKIHTISWSWTDDIKLESAEADALDEQGRGRATGNGELVRNMKLGDTITVWAKARFPGWVNIVDSIKVDIYWAV